MEADGEEKQQRQEHAAPGGEPGAQTEGSVPRPTASSASAITMPKATGACSAIETTKCTGLVWADDCSWDWMEPGDEALVNPRSASFCRPAKVNVPPMKSRSGSSVHTGTFPVRAFSTMPDATGPVKTSRARSARGRFRCCLSRWVPVGHRRPRQTSGRRDAPDDDPIIGYHDGGCVVHLICRSTPPGAECLTGMRWGPA